MASSEGVRNAVSAVSALRFVFTDTPSSVAPNAPPCPPPSDTLPPLPRASGTVEIRSNGLRIAPPTTSGSSSIRRFETAVTLLASSECSGVVSTTTFTSLVTPPGVSARSTRTVPPGVTVTPSAIDVWKPSSTACTR